MNYFVAGGFSFQVIKDEQNRKYQKNGDVFVLFQSNNELPHVWNDINKIEGISHYANIYKLSDDLTHAVLVKNGMLPSPHSVELTLELQDKVKLAIKNSKNLKQ